MRRGYCDKRDREGGTRGREGDRRGREADWEGKKGPLSGQGTNWDGEGGKEVEKELVCHVTMEGKGRGTLGEWGKYGERKGRERGGRGGNFR